jgi:23S rRNA pseudouridine955/2504/2580 synthase/23S rRNA pseudouridine1911/1915/1917 synthase
MPAPALTRRVSLVVQREQAGAGLLDFLAGRFTYHPRDAWLTNLVAGRIRLNGGVADPAAVLAIGDRIEYVFEAGPEPEVCLEYGVSYEDEHLLIVNKPGNLPCHPAGCFFNHTLWALLKERFGDRYFALCNRIDRETSGLLAVAKTVAATRHLQRQFARHAVEKRYLATVEGAFPETLDAKGWLMPDTACEVRKKRKFEIGNSKSEIREDGEWCETVFRRVAESGGLSLVEAAPRTGRLHQIRATLCSLGFPLVGDKIYGVDPTIFIRYCDGAMTGEDRQRLRLGRQALHAATLGLRHPEDNRPVEFAAPLPKDMRGLFPGHG